MSSHEPEPIKRFNHLTVHFPKVMYPNGEHRNEAGVVNTMKVVGDPDQEALARAQGYKQEGE